MKNTLSILIGSMFVLATSTAFSQDAKLKSIEKKEASIKVKSDNNSQLSETKTGSLKDMKLKRVEAKPMLKSSEALKKSEPMPKSSESIRSKKLTKFRLTEKAKAEELDSQQKK